MEMNIIEKSDERMKRTMIDKAGVQCNFKFPPYIPLGLMVIYFC